MYVGMAYERQALKIHSNFLLQGGSFPLLLCGYCSMKKNKRIWALQGVEFDNNLWKIFEA
jgi:hypothetical protein